MDGCAVLTVGKIAALQSHSVKEVFQATHLLEHNNMKNWLKTLHPLKTLIISIIGGTVLLLGMVLLFIPGPGIPVIFLGIIILAAEFLWARRLLKKIKGKSRNLKDYLSLKFK